MERKNKDLQHLSQISEKPSEAPADASTHVLYNRNVQGFDNPGYDSQSVLSGCGRVSSSRPDGAPSSRILRGQGSSQGASVISPTDKVSNESFK